MQHARILVVLFLLLAALAWSPGHAGNKAHLGFGTEVTISGFFSPKLKRVRINEVIPSSPAAKAGLLVDDELLEANGKLISGAPAREMARQLKDIKAGEHLKLKVKRKDGSIVYVDIVAGSS